MHLSWNLISKPESMKIFCASYKKHNKKVDLIQPYLAWAFKEWKNAYLRAPQQAGQGIKNQNNSIFLYFHGGFTTMAVIIPPERKLSKRTSVQWLKEDYRTRAIIIHGLYTFYPRFEVQTCFFTGIFLEILALCMVSIQEQFLIKSGIWWHPYNWG